AAEVSSSGAVNPFATVASLILIDPRSMSGTGGPDSAFATLSVPTTPAIWETRLVQWYALFPIAAQDEVAVRSKVPAARMYARRFHLLPNMDVVAWLFDCM